MPNALDAQITKPEKILVIGGGGSGKTTQLLTLPGKKFVYIFDPNALQSLRGFDVDYEEFVAEYTDIDLSVKTLKTGVGDNPALIEGRVRKIEPKTYNNWESHFLGSLEKNFFAPYDVIAIDSFTLFAETVMDRVMHLNKRLGKQPEQADWAAQINTIGNVFRAITGVNKMLFCTGHADLKQDELSKRVTYQLMMPGRMRVRLPLLFSNIFACRAVGTEKDAKYVIQTRNDRECPWVRTSIKGLDFEHDVTIKDFRKPQEYGIGALLKKHGLLPVTTTQTN